MVSYQLDGAERAIRTLEAHGRLKPEHAAIVEMVRGLAAAVDRHPDRSTLWREYRGAIEQLAQAAALIEQEDDGQAAFLKLVRTPVGDPPNPEPPDAGPASGGRRQAARHAIDAVAEASR